MRLGIKSKIMLLASLGIFVLIGVVLWISIVGVKKNVVFLRNAYYGRLNKLINYQIEDELKNISIIVETIINDKKTLEYFAERNRKALLEKYRDFYVNILKKEHHIAQFQFHIPPATSFLRVHNPSKYGDDLSAFRKTVVECNRLKKPVLGLEVGKAGLGLRAVYPAFYKGEHIGSVELGISIFDLMRDFAPIYDFEFAVGIYDEVFKRAHRIEDKPTDIVKGNLIYYAFEGNEISKVLKDFYDSDVAKINGKIFYSYKFPLKDFQGETIGYLFIIHDFSNIVSSSYKALYKNLASIAIICIIIAIVMVLFLGFAFKPLKNMVAILKELAKGEGDLNKRVPMKYVSCESVTGLKDKECAEHSGEKPCWSRFGEFSKNVRCPLLKNGKLKSCEECKVFKGSITDEISEISIWVNTFLNNIERDFRDTLYNLSGVSEKIISVSDTAMKVDLTIEENVHMASQVATASEEMNSTIMEISRSANDAASKADETLNVAEEGGKYISESVDHVERIKEVLDSLKEEISVLSENSTHIGDILSVINDIADQTNLLALNAAIEAARAGEHGRGFAVVADEVRKLAEKTQHSTKEIEDMIKEMQSNVMSVNAKTDEVSSTVEQQVDIAEKTNESFNQIFSSINELVSLIMSISSAVEQQSSATEQIARSIESVARSSEEAKQDIIVLNEEIDKMITGLQNTISMFSKFKMSSKGVIFAKAKLDHIIFVKNVLDCIATKECSFVYKDHMNCDFGKFYTGAGRKMFGNDSEFHQIEEPHKNVHHYGKLIIEDIKNGDTDSAKRHLEVMLENVRELIRVLDILMDRYK